MLRPNRPPGRKGSQARLNLGKKELSFRAAAASEAESSAPPRDIPVTDIPLPVLPPPPATSAPAAPAPPSAPTPATSLTMEVMQDAISRVLDARFGTLRSDLRSEATGIFTDLRKEMSNMSTSFRTEVSSISSGIAAKWEEKERQFDSRWGQIDSHIRSLATPVSMAPSSLSIPTPDPMPSFDSLPGQDPTNPWRSARDAVLYNGMLTIEGVGTRPVEDFVTFPPNARLPYCYVRLAEGASHREDKVPKETVLFPADRAQTCLLTWLRTSKCVNTLLLPEVGSWATYILNPDMPTPYMTK